jgi:type IV secretion system protein VirB8
MAWTVAGIAAGVAAFEAVALAMLTPLKTIEPVTLLVDRQTGYVQAVDPRTPRRVAADEALTQSYLAQYVAAREGFDRATVSQDYRKVALWSSGTARQSYLTQMPANNPASPFNVYAPGSMLSVAVKSVSPLGAGVALVRFDTELQDREMRGVQRQPWVAIVRYRYVDAPMSIEDRMLNPLGFQVLSYRRDAEAPAAPIQPVASASAYVGALSAAPANNANSAPSDAILVGGRHIPVSEVPLGSPLAPAARSGGRR